MTHVVGISPLRILSLLLLVLTFPRPAFAVTRTWDGGGGDNLWTTDANWSGDVEPGSADDVVFNNTSTASCFFNALSTTVASITFNSNYTGAFNWGYAGYGKGLRGMYFSDDGYTGSTFSRVDGTVNFASDWTTQPSGIGHDGIRVVWTGHVLAPATETVTFRETSDDGGRLWIDGNLIINQWAASGMTENTGTAPLVAGQLHEIKYEYYDGGGSAGAQLRWSSTSIGASTIIPQSNLFPDHNGLEVIWYSNTDLTGTSGTSMLPFPDVNWNAGGPDEVMTNDDFSAKFDGYIVPDYTETYTFYATKDDGVRLYVNDVLILDSWTCGCTEQTSATINLVAGAPYYIYAEYRDTSGDGEFHLSWSSPSLTKEVIPQDHLYPAYVLSVTGNADFRSGGTMNLNVGKLAFTGTGAQTFHPKSGATFGRVFQSGSGTTTVTTNNLVARMIRVQSGTFHLGAGRTITPNELWVDGGTINFGTSTLSLAQPTISFANLASATSGANGSKLLLNSSLTQTLTGTITGTDIDVEAAGTGALTISGVLATGTGTFTKSGSGDLTLSGANTFSGGYTHSGSGQTFINHNTALGSGTATINGGGRIRPGDGITVANALVMNATNPGTGNGALCGPAAGTGTWSGTITINQDAASDGGHLEGGNNVTGLVVSGAITSSVAVVSRESFVTLSGGGSYPKLVIGTHKVILGANNGICTTAEIEMGGSGNAILDLNSFSQTVVDLSRASNTATVTNASGTLSTLTINNAADESFSGNITGNIAMVKSGAGAFQMQAANSYTGGTRISAGTLSISAENHLGAPSGATLLEFTGNATLAVTTGFATSKEFLTSGSSRKIAFDIASGQTLTCNGNVRSTTSATAGRVTKSGAGTLVLAVNNDQLDSDIDLLAGTLEARAVSAFGNDWTNDFVYAAAGTTIRLVSDGGLGMNSSLQAEGTGVNVVLDRLTGGAANSNGFYKFTSNGAYTVNFSAGANVTSGTVNMGFDGAATLNGHTVLDVTDPGTPDFALSFSGTMSATNMNLTVQGTGNTTISGAIQTGSGTLTKAGAGTLYLSGNNTYTGLTTVSAGTLRLGHANALGTTAAGTSVTSGAALDLSGTNYSTAEALTLNGTGISSGGALMNSGGSATFAGLITLGSAASIIAGSGDITIGNAGTITGPTFGLTLGGASNGTLASILGTTSGTLTKRDAGTWTLSGASTFTGNVDFVGGTSNNGSLLVTHNNGLGSGSKQVNLPGTNTASETIKLSGGVTVSGALLRFAGHNGNSGILLSNVSGDNSWLGGMSIVNTGGGYTIESQAGTLTLGGTIQNGIAGVARTYGFNGAGNINISGTVVDGSNTTGLSLSGSGTVTLSGTNTYTGTTTVNSGTLEVTGSTAAGSAVTVASGATLAGTGNVNGTVTVNNGGIVAPGGSGVGTLYSAATVLNGTSVMNFTLSPTSDKLAVTGNLTLDGTINITAGTDFTYGVYTLFTYTGSLVNNTLAIGTLPTGYYGTITAGSGVVTLSLLDYTGWNYASNIFFNTTSSGANVSGDVTDFPMLVRLDSNNFFFEQAMPDGRDIRFADPDGSPLAYEIERWDATARKAEIWVKVPQVDGNSQNDFITCYWGNASATSQSSGSSVFGTSAGFQGTWHLEEDGNTTASGYQDASGNALHGTGVAMTASSDVDAIVGKGQTFDGSSTYISIPANSTLGSLTSNFTVSAWGFADVLGGGSGRRILSADRQTTNNGMGLGTNTTNEPLATTYGVKDYATSGSALTTRRWYHVAIAVDAAFDAQIYVDGVFKQTVLHGAAGVANTDDVWLIGQSRAAGVYIEKWDGILDEVRVEGTTRSADWIKLNYETQKINTPAVVYPNSALSTWAYNTKLFVNTTASGANVPGDVSNFPMLVRLTPANFNFSQARSDGADLRFADSAGALLPYEIERFNAVSKLAEVWVLLPVVKGNNNSQWFRMYWGKGSASSLSSSASVFKVANNMAGVWHMHDVANFSEAAGLAATGTNSGAANASGIIGNSSHFDADADKISVPAYSALEASNLLTDGNAYATFSFWVNASDDWNSAANRRLLFTKGRNTAGASDQDWAIFLDPGDDKIRLETRNSASGWTTMSAGKTDWDAGTWYHLAFVNDIAGKSYQWYVNGAAEGASQTYVNSHFEQGDAPNIEFGEHLTDTWFQGYLDEVRVFNASRSADWIKLSYETQKAGSAVVAVGERSQSYARSAQFTFNTTSSGANVPGNVANIPILVRLSGANFDFSASRDDASDIKFVDKDGTNLYHEVVEWDKANRSGMIWVKVPQVDGNSLTDFITAYYGCAACTGNPYALKDSVWQDYVGVYHLNAPETAANDAGTLKNNGTFAQSLAQTSGITTRNTVSLDGTTNNHILLPTESNYDFTNSVLVSAWVKPGTSWSSAYQTIVSKGDDSWRISRGNTTNFAHFGLSFSTVVNTQSITGNTVNLVDGSWHYVVGAYNGSTIKLYVDGVQEGSTINDTRSMINNSYNAMIGRNDQHGRNWLGALNEVRLSSNAAVMTADYIKLSYQNQKEGSLLFSSAAITTASFSSSKAFRFNTTASGANVSGDVFDFPLLLRFTDATLIDATQSAGQDIRFLDGDGVTWLDYQIERWDQTNNVGEIWVKVPKVDGNSSGDFITMYYNDVSNGSVPDGQCGSCVFGTTSGIAAAWHMGEDPTGGAGALKDQSGNANHGTATGMVAGDAATGQIGKGLTFDGTDAKATFGTSATLQPSEFSLSLWFKRTASMTGLDRYPLWFKPNDVWDGNGWYVHSQDGTNQNQPFMLVVNGGKGFSLTTPVDPDTFYPLGTWTHLFATFSSITNAMTLYKDGVAIPMSSWNSPEAISGTADTKEMGEAWGVHVAMALDEVQISSTVRSADWIRLTYESQKASPSLFNPNTVDFVSSQKLIFNTTKTGANVMGDVENFPLLVRFTGTTIVDAVQNDWDDIRFLDGDGKTWLQYQVERWDKTNDVAEVWVLVPKVDGNSDRDFITVYYNDVSNGAVPSGQCGSCVFSSGGGFAGVWHLAEDAAGTGTAALYNDATANANHGTDNVSATGKSGAIGQGQQFDGLDDNVLVGTFDPSTTNLTFSGWINWTGDDGSHQTIIAKRTSWGTGTMRWQIHREDQLNELFWYTAGSGADFDNDIPSTGNWIHMTVTSVNGGTVRMYLNGAQVGPDRTMTWDGGTGAQVRIGSTDINEAFNGSIDEVRLDNVIRSTDWIKLSYETQRATGNLFWNSRPGPNNKSTLTATPGAAGITLTWTTPVTDSANADSVGIWVRYSGPLDSVGATGQTKVAVLPLTDSSYTYPATYDMTYYFALAVRNSNGKWSPFTAASTDTVQQVGNSGMYDTIYVDSAIGSNAYTCAQARNPATPRLTIDSADNCDIYSNDTLVIRVMPGTYVNDYKFDSNNDPVVVTSFDNRTRAVFSHPSGSETYNSVDYKPTLYLYGGVVIRNLDVMAGQNGGTGVMTIKVLEHDNTIEGCRIYNNGSNKHAWGIVLPGTGANFQHVANNIIHQPTSIGILSEKDDYVNIMNNTLIGDGSSGDIGIHFYDWAFIANMTITNNILYNWDYGIQTNDNTAAFGVISNNLFHMVTSGRELTVATDANRVIRDPMFYSTDIRHPQGFKLLPGSPAIDAGTTNRDDGYASKTVPYDLWGTTRAQGSAVDIGAYEGTGYTPNPTGDFDTLTNTVSGNTVIVKNSKFKLVWDMARGGGITGFYNMAGDTTANLVGTNSLLFDVRLDAFIVSSATSNNIAPIFIERTRARSLIKQRVAFTATADLNVYYTVYPSGHVFIQSEVANLSGGTVDIDVVQYGLKVGSATSASISGGILPNNLTRKGFGYLNLPTRDAFLSVTRDLDGDSNFTETWAQTASVAGSLDSVTFSTADLADPTKNMSRHHHFLLYVGDLALDQAKASTLNADAYTPSVVTLSAGSLLHEKSWQDRLAGNWNFDEGAGTLAKDVSFGNTNNTSSLTATTWVSGKIGGALRFGATSVAVVNDNDAFEVRRHFTVAFWVKPNFATMGSTAFFLSKGLTSSNGWSFQRVSGGTALRFRVDGATADSPPLITGTWYHVAGVVGASGQLYLYINGVLVSASLTNATLAVNTDALRMGENDAVTAANRFAGDLDDVRIYHFSVPVGQIQAVANRGFSTKHGLYHLRADNNNRVVALLNGDAAATRVQPAFEIDNWYGTKNPKYVYLNGTRLTPNVDYAVDSAVYTGIGIFGSNLFLQLNKVLTGADQTLFVDDNDSSGYMGEAARMKSLSVTATAGDKIALQNFTGSTFGSATSGQWYLELDLTGWTDYATARVVDTGFGGFNVWKAAGANPGLAVSSAANQVGQDNNNGRSLAHMSYHGASADFSSSGQGYFGPASLTYTVVDSSATRLSMVLETISLKSDAPATASLVKRWTVYPNGRIIGSFTLSSPSVNMLNPRLDFLTRNASGSAQNAWANTTAASTGRWAAIGSNVDMHSSGVALLSVKNATATYDTIGTQAASGEDFGNGTLPQDYYLRRLNLQTSYYTTANAPVTTNFVIDISRDFTDALTADSLLKDLQTPAVITALGAGTANPTDALDYGSPSNADGFAEGDGAYVYTAGSGVAHFKFVNTVTHFSPAFRIKSWTFASLPEYVIVDNQSLVKGYHYNAYVSTGTDELIIQFNKTFKPGTHLFYISHKTGLAVTLNHFEAVPGEGVDSLKWSTESEFENLGFHVWRRIAPVQPLPDHLADGELEAGAGIANALRENARQEAAQAAQAKAHAATSATAAAKTSTNTEDDSLPSLNLSPQELKALGYVRLTAKLIPGAPGGSSATTQAYLFVDRSAAFGTTYEYLLEAVDFSGAKVQYGPRAATPGNPLETALLPNYPNPFNPVTTLRFSLKEQAKVSLLVYDVKGRLVRTLIRPDKAMRPGKYRLLWDALDDRGFQVPSGQYFYRFSAPRYSKTRKMILVK